MSLSAHFNICSVVGWGLIAYFSHCEFVACHFIGLTVFDWMPDIVNFTLLSAGYFCNPVDPLGICSGTVKLLETV